MNEIILVGYFKETAELCKMCGCKIIGVIDNVKCDDYQYLGNDDCFVKTHLDYIDIPLVITPDNPNVRYKLYDMYKKLGFKFQTLVSPKAVISPSAHISEGCMIQSLCNISSDVTLGVCARINTGANIMHDSIIGDFAIVAPGAVVLGRVVVGERTYIGAHCTILPNVELGVHSVIGAGAVVTKNVPNEITVVGVPARVLKKDE